MSFSADTRSFRVCVLAYSRIREFDTCKRKKVP